MEKTGKPLFKEIQPSKQTNILLNDNNNIQNSDKYFSFGQIGQNNQKSLVDMTLDNKNTLETKAEINLINEKKETSNLFANMSIIDNNTNQKVTNNLQPIQNQKNNLGLLNNLNVFSNELAQEIIDEQKVNIEIENTEAEIPKLENQNLEEKYFVLSVMKSELIGEMKTLLKSSQIKIDEKKEFYKNVHFSHKNVEELAGALQFVENDIKKLKDKIKEIQNYNEKKFNKELIIIESNIIHLKNSKILKKKNLKVLKKFRKKKTYKKQYIFFIKNIKI